MSKKMLNEKKKDSKMSAACEPNNFLIASHKFGNLQVVNYSSTRPGPHCSVFMKTFQNFQNIFFMSPLDSCF